MSYDHVLSFWLGVLDEHGAADAETRKRWWRKSDDFDAEIRDQFLADHHAIMHDQREDWLESPHGRLAYIIVLDQFSRNMFRGDPAMYAGDGRAERATIDGIERDHHLALRSDERVFLLMPLMHSESLALQERSVALFRELAEEMRGTPVFDQLANNVRFAEQHRDIVAEWGRFPHRNAILGRPTTPEEAAFLEKPGSSF